MHNCILDILAGGFSIIQVLIDYYNLDGKDVDPSTLSMNWGKLALGLVCIVFDIIFVYQHYVLYLGNVPEDEKIKELKVDLLSQDMNDEKEIVRFMSGDASDCDAKTADMWKTDRSFGNMKSFVKGDKRVDYI